MPPLALRVQVIGDWSVAIRRNSNAFVIPRQQLLGGREEAAAADGCGDCGRRSDEDHYADPDERTVEREIPRQQTSSQFPFHGGADCPKNYRAAQAVVSLTESS